MVPPVVGRYVVLLPAPALVGVHGKQQGTAVHGYRWCSVLITPYCVLKY